MPTTNRRVSPGLYKLVLTTHVATSVSWLGVAATKLAIGLAIEAADTQERADALFLAIDAVNVAFPVMALASLISGVVLSLVTKYGLLRFYWVTTKLLLTIAVIITSVQIGPRITALMQNGVQELPLRALLALTITHVVMLVGATVLSTYKPWSRTWLGRRQLLAQRSRQNDVTRALT
jgi:hypothetical protein